MATPSSLKELRIRAGMSQQQMADFLQVSRSYISMAEGGNRTLPVKNIHLLLGLEETMRYARDLQIGERLDIITTNEEMLHALKMEWEFKLKTAEYQLLKSKHKLVAMVKLYDETLTAYNSYSMMIQKMAGNPNDHHELLFRFQYSEMRRKLAKCNEACQEKLKWRIECYEAEIKLLEKFLSGDGRSTK
jgi:transcriptional regulator with XRE-family HTH domain